jgi:Icc-related predicted phosphoesterase
MKICAISDQHGNLPKIPSCDLFLIAGDICPATNHSVDFQEYWLETQFKNWLKDVDAKEKVYICGNHDFFFEKASKNRIQKALEKIPGIYLQDSSTEFDGLNIYGTPWQPYFFDWAFNLYENDLKKKWELIPKNTDVLIVHGPPSTYGDYAPRPKGKGGEHTGSPSLLGKIKEIEPKLCVFGHIHEGRGEWDLDKTKLANVTILDGKYQMVHEPWIYNL